MFNGDYYNEQLINASITVDNILNILETLGYNRHSFCLLYGISNTTDIEIVKYRAILFLRKGLYE